MPAPTVETRETRPGTRVTMAAILDSVHSKWAKQVANLVQENAELTASVETLTAERDELAAMVQALRPAAEA